MSSSATSLGGRSDVVVGGGVARWARSHPDALAVTVDAGDDLTYGTWEHRSNALARGLAARGVEVGDRVGLLFPGRSWGDFAVAHLGVRKRGAVAVLVSSGAAGPDLARALAHAGVCGVLCAEGARVPVSTWSATTAEVDSGQDPSPVEVPVEPAELVYPLAPLAPARPYTPRGGGEAATGAAPGPFVHAWTPGSPGGPYALALMQAGPASGVVAVDGFDPDRFCAVVAGRRAAACGLTPALAAGLVASGADARHDLSSVGLVVLSGRPTAGTWSAIGDAFPGASLRVVDDGPVAGAAAGGPPAAVSQEPMLWHEQFAPGSFNLPCLVRRHRGPLDVAALEWTFAELARRHPPLRTTFAVVGGSARQVVGGHGFSPLTLSDLGRLSADDRDGTVALVLAEATSRPFDLATGPLFAPQLLRLGPDDHLLVVRLHHTVFDDWSVDVFRRELSALYAARLTGAPSPLLEPPTSFAEVATRQAEWRAGAGGAAERAWWREELDGAPLAVQLPIGGDGADRRAQEPLRLQLPAALVAALRAAAPTLRATPFMTALAAFSVVVARATGLDDLVIATVVAHRTARATEPLIGCFTKKVPVRLRVDGDPTFAELVGRTRASLSGALSHQDVGFETALDEGLGRPAAEHGVVPHVAVVFQAETPRQAKLDLPGLVSTPYEVRAEARQERHFSAGPERAEGSPPRWGDGIYLGTFLVLSLAEDADGMALVARGVFSRPAATRLLDDLVAVLGAAVAEPSRPVSALEPGRPAGSPVDADVVDVRGFRASRSRLEAALRQAPGVGDVAVAVAAPARLVAYVVAGDGPGPTLAGLRQALWERLPGAIWPAELVLVDGLPTRPGAELVVEAPPPADPLAVVLAAMWRELGGGPADPGRSYWQDFSFLQVLAEAREAGLVVDDEQVVHCRTPAVLAAAIRAAQRSPD